VTIGSLGFDCCRGSLVIVALIGDAKALLAGPADLGNVLTKLLLASGVGLAAS